MNRAVRYLLVLCLAASSIAVGLSVDPGDASAIGGSPRVDVGTTTRIAGIDRYATAEQIARTTYPDLSGIDHVIIASGEPQSAVDVLAASGLGWAYDAPLLLVNQKSMPGAVGAYLRDLMDVRISSELSTPSVTIVGGTGAVQASVKNAITSIVGTTTVEQPWTAGDRYDTAAGVATRIFEEAYANPALTVPSSVFLVRGDDSLNLFDALSATAVTRATGTPVLYANPKGLPAATASALTALGGPEVITIGGTGVIPATVMSAAGSTVRWSGADRYATNAATIEGAVSRGWIDTDVIGVTSSIPDGATGAGLVGKQGGAIVLSEASKLNRESGALLSRLAAAPSTTYLLGGVGAVSQTQESELTGGPSTPVLGTNTPPMTTLQSTAPVRGVANFNAVTATLLLNGVESSTVDVALDGTFDFGNVAIPAAGTTVSVRVTGPDARTAISAAKRVSRGPSFPYPYSTMIVVDKSDFRLYWIRDGALVKSYQVSIGKPWTPTPAATWKILHKEYMTNLRLGFGPARMRLYRSDGHGGFYRTGYLIHGQSSPLTVGTMESAGCVRMHNHEVLELYPQVPIGTMVITRE